jgi:4-hydroxybenzoate polyprenyltransferase
VFSSVKAINVGGALIECRLMERILNAYPNAQIRQIYGGTEVEPVCVVDAKTTLERSLNRGFSHCLFLGRPIPELKTKLDSDGVLWVSGDNVCGQYIMSSEHDNMKKEIDDAQALWHSMGDRIVTDDDGFWFNGRAIQHEGDFALEQELYRALGHTRAYIHRGPDSHAMIVGDDNVVPLQKAGESVFDSPVEVVSGTIRRDRRHRSRIDREGTWRLNLRAARIVRYLKERSPLPVLMVLALGPLVSGWMFASRAGLCNSSCLSPQNSIYFVVGLIASLLFLIAARAMDEIKDSKKDQTANPDRPLPRGLVDLSELKLFLKLILMAMLFCCAFLLVVGHTLSAMLITVSTMYLWLMYKEFYIASWLAKFPLLYAGSHQVVVLPLTLFGFTLVFNPSGESTQLEHFDVVPVSFVVANLFASLTYEFSRKLQPDKHLDAQTYRHIYGHRTATFLTIIFALLSMTSFVTYSTWAASETASLPKLYLVPLHASLILILLWHALRDGKHRYAEGVAALLLIASSWYGLISFW